MPIVSVVLGLLVWAVVITLGVRRVRGRSPAAARRKRPPEPVGPQEAQRTLQELFTDGATLARASGAQVRVESIAMLTLPTGRIVACDPIVFPDSAAFERSVPPGSYPVSVSLALMGPGHIRVAGMRVELSQSTPVRWEAALVTGQVAGAVAPGESFGYGVDAGLGCFMDAATAATLARVMNEVEGPSGNYYDDVLATELSDVAKPWCDHHPVAADGANVVIAQSGWGDGMYSSHWGIDEGGDTVCLVTDFQVG